MVEQNLYFKSVPDFDLYSHLKSNIKNHCGICEIHDSDFTTYCITCRRSICEVCRDSYHCSHSYMDKKDVNVNNKLLIEKIFADIEKKIDDTDIFNMPKRTLTTIQAKINNEFEVMSAKLLELKSRRLKELDNIFGLSNNDGKKLNSYIKKTKESVLEFLDRQKQFYSIGENIDVDNFTFLSLYDIIFEIDTKTREYHETINSIKAQFNKYENLVNNKYCSKIVAVIEESLQEQKKLEVLTSNMIVLDRIEPDISKSTKISSIKLITEKEFKSGSGNTGNLYNNNSNDDFKNSLAYSYDKLIEDVYAETRSKLSQISEHNEGFKQNVYESFKKTGSLLEIDKMLKIYEDKTSKRVQYNSQVNSVKISQSKGSVLARSKNTLKIASTSLTAQNSGTSEKKESPLKRENTNHVITIKEEEEDDKNKNEDSQISFHDKDDQIDVGIGKNKKLHENKELLRINNMFKPKQKKEKPEKNIIQSLPSKKDENESDDKYKSKLVDILKENQRLSVMIKTKDDCNLNVNSVRKFYSYSILEFIRKNFYKANKNHSSHILFSKEKEQADCFETVKVFEGTADIQIYDREKRTITRKTVKIDKKKFGTNVFYNGCRTFICLEKLYISGGKDFNGDKKAFWCYDIKEGKLEKLGDMAHARSFHTMVYHENLRSLMVFGGENNCSCEMYDFYLNIWNPLPNLNFPRANVSVYLDKVGTFGYALCGIIGEITSPVFSDQIELLDLVDMNQGWAIVDYNNKSNVDLRKNENKVYPLTDDKLLIYGALEYRTIHKVYCIFDLRTFILRSVDEEELGDFKIQSILNPARHMEKSLAKQGLPAN